MDDLSVSITGPNNQAVEFSTTSDDSESLVTVDRITTKWGTGHESAQLTLHRDPLKRFDDIDLLYDVSITAADGTEVFGGRVSGLNPESGRTQINCVGNWSSAKDRSGVSELFVDRSMERWSGMPLNRRAAVLAAGYAPEDGTTTGATIVTKIPQPVWTAGSLPAAEAWYTAPAGTAIGKIVGVWTRSGAGVGTGGTPHRWVAVLATNDTATTANASGDLEAAGPAAFVLDSTTADRKFASLSYYYDAAYGTADSIDRSITWSQNAVVGVHGLTSITPSTVVKFLTAKYCPGLTYDADSIVEHTYEIPHLVLESTDVAEGWARANAFANWTVNVWGNKVHFGPDPSLTEPDFILDIDRGDLLDPDGQTIDNDRPVNGVEVFYTDSLTGRAERVGPDDDYRLRSDDPENPCNKMGIDRWGKLDISFPATEDDAIQIGSVWFAEASTPNRVGSGTAVGMVLARDGSEVPVSSIRSGHVVRYAHEAVGRLVYSTTYEPGASKIDLKFDNAPATLSAVLERIGVALTVVGGK
jgi:hypothetical protein